VTYKSCIIGSLILVGVWLSLKQMEISNPPMVHVAWGVLCDSMFYEWKREMLYVCVYVVYCRDEIIRLW